PYDELGRYAGPGEGAWSEKSGEEKYEDLSGRLVLTQSGPGQQNRRTLEKGAHLPELHDWPSGIDQHGRILCKDGTLCKTDPRDMFPKTENVRDKNLDPRITSQYETIGRIFKEHGAEVVITSANDSKHMQNSLHYKNLAVDIRGKKDTHETMNAIRKSLQDALGPDYDVLYETYKNKDLNHIHIEYDPKMR
uniref:hypothetical protein n=1 Tax=Desulfovibrio aminophilus TaxID=81425 RepID=UPI00146D1F8A